MTKRIMTESAIDYEKLAQDALRGVVRTVLARVALSEHLPGNHHFYISFNTRREGVSISKRLREQYPEEMTIVLQHRYWDLQVHDDRFEVKLTFNSIPERLVVPFEALKVFFDPSVPYGLQFDSGGVASAETLPNEPASPLVLPQKRAAKRGRPPQLREARSNLSREQAPDAGKPDAPQRLPVPGPKTALPAPSVVASGDREPAKSGAAAAPPAAAPPGQIVQLDAFRKK